MALRLARGKVTGIPFTQARRMGGVITPTILILHDTASRLEKGRAAAYLADNTASVSVHFVIERDGSIVQQVPIGRAAFHAGRSSYNNRKNCNDFSIGIEIVNAGRMDPAGPDKARAWWGETFDRAALGIVQAAPATHGPGLWMAYTPEQIEAVLTLGSFLFAQVPTLMDVVTHWYVAPGRKTDTNPLFPLASVKARIMGRDDPAALAADREAAPVKGDDQFVKVNAPADSVNLRTWPSFNPNVIAQVPDGAVVPVLSRGVFEGRSWLKVIYGGHEGWVIGRYTQPVSM
ncbi:MAG: N-acetylmuramoyl-L-alanine amidase [Hyphomonadaceae bacterium]|jgi:N-acetylmuramoyl-L-alanine amidase|nr:N-acetylmuramoyl-L-alanine amidase [Hyphomonadaceae bacterium]